MDSWLQYIFTEREYAKLVSKVLQQNCKEPTRSPPNANEVRGFVRLFIKTWIAGLAARKVTGARFEPVKLSSALVLCALSYRLLYKRLPNSDLLRDNKVRASISGVVAGYILARGLPTGASLYAAVYLASKVCEWGYNIGDDMKKFDWKPDLLGTWALFPFAFGQLFHSLILSPETCPRGFKRLMVALSNGALKARSYPNDVVQGIAHASLSRFPEFRSTLIYRIHVTTSNLTIRSHPGNRSFIGALLHPGTDSDIQFFFDNVFANLSLFAKYLLPIYLLQAYLGRTSYKDAAQSTLRVALSYSMAAASAIAGIQLSQSLTGRQLSPKVRFRLIGFLSGLWAVLNQERGRAQFLYATRLAIISLIPLRSQRGVAQVLLPVSMALAFNILGSHPEAITQRLWRKIGNWVQQGEWTDEKTSEKGE